MAVTEGATSRSRYARWLSTTLLLIVFCQGLQVVFTQDIDSKADVCKDKGLGHTEVYFKVDTTSCFTLVEFNPILCPNNTKLFELHKVIILYPPAKDDCISVYWNETAVLLTIPQSSPLKNYSKAHEVCMKVWYANKCNSSTDNNIIESDILEEYISLHLLPLSIQLTIPTGELVVGRPLNLTCSVLGYITKETKNNVKIKYTTPSNANINNDCYIQGDDTSACHFEKEHSLNCTCTVHARTNRSDSGNYFCDLIIGDTTTLSSDEKNLKVVNAQNFFTDHETIIIAASSSVGGVLILLAIALAIAIIIKKIAVRRPHHPIQADDHVHQQAIPPDNGNQVRRHGWNNEIVRNQIFKDNFDGRRQGRHSPVRPASAKPNTNRHAADERRRLLRGYDSESAM